MIIVFNHTIIIICYIIAHTHKHFIWNHTKSDVELVYFLFIFDCKSNWNNNKYYFFF